MRPVIILRPEPGAEETAARALTLGLTVRLCPLFEARAVAWTAPAAAQFDALLLTSAQAARLAGPQLAAYRNLPAYAVGGATARALAAQGFDSIVSGDQDGNAIAARIAADGHRRVLHLGGRTVAAIAQGPLSIQRTIIYEMVGRAGAELATLLQPGAVLLIHSPRAGQKVADLVPVNLRDQFHIVAISPAALSACGDGWASAETPDRPDDERMLALAARLCE
ncbi:uroporphyrinogen-III synthase [Sphingobium vermicomposti]|uniref:Uroporphyrinogen-III synthase n=1 Tax=Sphingobium vermicomposti TaxID=529005 RepID=A0A846M5Z2_9SPHN|nr:uroporphyrinogen-III synthase [Sphingobium vermicomposti]